MTIRVWSHPTCSTCRRALAWLQAKGVAHQVRPIATEPPSRAELESLWRRSGLPIRRMFNTSGRAYREGGVSAKLATMDDAAALDLLAGDGMLIKRPLVDAGERALVGFQEDRWAEVLDD